MLITLASVQIAQAEGAEGGPAEAGAGALKSPQPVASGHGGADPIEVSGEEGPPAPPQAIAGAPFRMDVDNP